MASSSGHRPRGSESFDAGDLSVSSAERNRSRRMDAAAAALLSRFVPPAV